MSYDFANVKVLIVDDMKPMLALASSVLKIFGFKKIDVASNPDQAFDMFCKVNYELVITDWMMEPMNGLELTKKFRRSPLSPNPYVPVVMMTGFSSRPRVESARDMGITEFLVKPFSSRDLYSRVVQIIEKPRQFVDAGTYFGPDRRRKLVNNYDGPKRREVDNPEGLDTRDPNIRKINNILNKLKEETRTITK